MKKILAMLLALCMIFALAACGETAPAETKPAEEPAAEAPAEEPAAEEPAAEEPAAEEPAAEEPAAEEPAAEEPAAEGGMYKLGMGISLNMDSSKAGNAQVDACVAAVILDETGKIVAVKIDVAQNKMDVTDGAVDTEQEFLTKLEKGDAYGMKKASAIGLDWYEQAAGLQAWLVGKTIDEFKAAVENKDETLLAVCSITATDFVEAAEKAIADALAE